MYVYYCMPSKDIKFGSSKIIRNKIIFNATNKDFDSLPAVIGQDNWKLIINNKLIGIKTALSS